MISLCDFQNIWSFLVFVTMLIHSWALFTLIACWLAISEEMSLKSIILLFLNQIPWIYFSQDKSSIKSEGVWIGRACFSSRKSWWNIIENPIIGNFSHDFVSLYLEPIIIFWTSSLNGRSRLLFQGDIILCGLYQYLIAILSSPSSPSSFKVRIYSLSIWCICPVKTGVSSLTNQTAWFWTLDMSSLSL
jgi:hypothetical protein